MGGSWHDEGRVKLVSNLSLPPNVDTYFLHGYKGESIPVYCIDFDLPGAAKEFSIRVEAVK